MDLIALLTFLTRVISIPIKHELVRPLVFCWSHSTMLSSDVHDVHLLFPPQTGLSPEVKCALGDRNPIGCSEDSSPISPLRSWL